MSTLVEKLCKSYVSEYRTAFFNARTCARNFRSGTAAASVLLLDALVAKQITALDDVERAVAAKFDTHPRHPLVTSLRHALETAERELWTEVRVIARSRRTPR